MVEVDNMSISGRDPLKAEISSDTLLTGLAPSLSRQPRPPDSAAAAPPLSSEAVRILASTAPLPPPRRKLLEGLALLWHDHWEDAHSIAQSREDAINASEPHSDSLTEDAINASEPHSDSLTEGQADYDLLHAMVHRREGDYPNADYWFRAAGRHPSHALLELAISKSPPDGLPSLPSLLPGGRWSPKVFSAEVRRVAGAARSEKETEILIRLQALEFRAFSDWLLSA